MKISMKGRYALRMLTDLAEHQHDGYIALKDVAKRQAISKKYLEQIVPILNNGNILRTNRGIQGGYMLAQAPYKYTVGEILRLTEGSLSPVDCTDQSLDLHESSGEYAMLPIWEKLDLIINQYLDSVTLQDVLDLQRERYANDYVI